MVVWIWGLSETLVLGLSWEFERKKEEENLVLSLSVQYFSIIFMVGKVGPYIWCQSQVKTLGPNGPTCLLVG